jgi:hypothetical protein
MKKISFILICISIVFASSVFIDYSYNLKSIVLSLSVPILLLSIVVGIVDHYRKSQLTIIGIVIPMIIGVIVASFVFFKILNAVPSVE